MAVTDVVLEAGGVATAVGLRLQPWLRGPTEVVAAAPAVSALLKQLLLAEAMGPPLSSCWLYQGGGAGGGGCGNGEEGKQGFHGSDGFVPPWVGRHLLVLPALS